MVSAGVVWTAVKVVAALTALLIGAVCVVVCYRDERAKEQARDKKPEREVCPHFNPHSAGCLRCGKAPDKASEEMRHG